MTELRKKVDEKYLALCEAAGLGYATVLGPLDGFALIEASMMLVTTTIANAEPEHVRQQLIESIIEKLPRQVAKRRAEIERHRRDYRDVVEEIVKQ
jgi:hypothetical protein